jgi:hypothetical protein
MNRIIIMLLSMTANLYPYNNYLGVYVGSGDNPSKVRVQIIDSQGRKTGFVGFEYDEDLRLMIPSGISEIPRSNCLSESVGSINPETDEPVEGDVTPESIHCGIEDVSKDTYTIRFIGLDNSTFSMQMEFSAKGKETFFIWDNPYQAFISSGAIQDLKLFLDPTPGAAPPVLTKVVTFQTLRDDFNVSYKLNQIGDDKFVKSLIRMVDIAEMISKRCDKLNDKAKHRCYRPVVVILRMVVKRLEVVNRLCNQPERCIARCKATEECDEDEALKMFESKYRKDDDLKVFFNSWDKDEWHKHKKKCKRFITDEALEIVSADINWLIKGFGDDVWDNYKKEQEPYIPEKYKNFFK